LSTKLNTTPIPAILVINSGSSSIKFAVFNDANLSELVKGQIDGIGSHASFKAKSPDLRIQETITWPQELAPQDHGAALKIILEWLHHVLSYVHIQAVGHRVVHGGAIYLEPVLINDSVIHELESFYALAPLHEPHNIDGIKAAREVFGDIPQIACFDTAFHRSQSYINDTYALPRAFYEEGVRRYGFHGLSYEYINSYVQQYLPAYFGKKTVVAHLGNGASLCALENGYAVATTMGFSPLDGIPMGSRSGQVDPGVLLYLMQYKKWDAQRISDLLYKESGLKGLSGGLSNDMRTLETSSAIEAKEAISYFVQHVQQEILSLAAIMKGLDVLVFTGGIGENSIFIRGQVMQGLQWVGIELNTAANDSGAEILSNISSKIACLRIATNEELMIAKHTHDLSTTSLPQSVDA
jgi:acetate kinase